MYDENGKPKVVNRLMIDFDAMPVEVASALAQGIENFINASRDHFGVRLHGTCSALDDETLVWEVEGRADLRRRLGPVIGEDILCRERFTRNGLECNRPVNHDGPCNPVQFVGENPFERE